MKYKGAALLVVGIVLGILSIAAPLSYGGVLNWVLGAIGVVISFFITITGIVVLRGPEHIEKLAKRRDELR